MRTILFLLALACRLQYTALFLAQVQSVHTYNRPTLPTYVSSQGRPIHHVVCTVHPTLIHISLTYLPRYLVVCLDDCDPKVALRPPPCPSVRPSAHVSNFLKKKRAASEFPVYSRCVGCLVSSSPILHVGLQEEEEEPV